MTPTRSPGPAGLLVHRADLGDVAWQVLLRDGHVTRLLDDVGLPAAVPATPVLRAAALAPGVPAREAVARSSAVWVHLGGPAPARPVTTAVPGHEVRDVVRLAGVRVTTPRRTARDLLALDPPDVARALVLRLVAEAGVDLAHVHADLTAAAARRGVRRALALLRDLRAGAGQASTGGCSAALAPVMR